MKGKGIFWSTVATLAGLLGIISCGTPRKAAKEATSQKTETVKGEAKDSTSAKSPSDTSSSKRRVTPDPGHRVRLMYGVPPSRYMKIDDESK